MTNDPRFDPSLHPHIQSLQQALGGQLTEGLVHEWMGEDLDRVRFLDKTILGTIRWDRDLGRPNTPTLTASFIIAHQEEKIDIQVGPEGPTDLSHPIDSDPPVTWDGPETEEGYSVGFICNAHLKDFLTVGIAPGVKWEGQSAIFAGPHTVDPPSATVKLGESKFATVSFQVVPVISPEAHPRFDG
jgi:hypothetical protein